MYVMSQIHTTRDRQRSTLPMLLGLTAVVLTMQSPLHTDTVGLTLPQLEFPTPSQIMEMRPGTPPPWMEGEQLAMDEPDQVPNATGVHRDQTVIDDPRARPQR